ncbi:tetratricopeptide repeat protein [soil metagenome]
MNHAVDNSILQYWESLVREDDSMPSFEAALAVAPDAYPSLDLSDTLNGIDAMADKLQKRFAADAPMLHKLRLLNHFFFNELHFRGNVNDYYDADNSYLNKVIERRCGIPITLAAIYIEIGQQVGIPLQGLSFPGHYLVKLKLADGAIVIDVFDGGRSLSREDLEERLEPYLRKHGLTANDALPAFLEAASGRAMLARLLHNLKSIHLRDGDQRRLLAVLNRLVVLLPEDLNERRDRGLCLAELGCVDVALDDLMSYVDEQPMADDVMAIRERIDELRRQAGQPLH